MSSLANIVECRGQSAVTTSLVVSEGCDLSHQSALRLIKKYRSDFDEFGEVGFEIRLNPQGTPTEFAILNEDQATYLITLFRNNKIVRRFKINLVKAFRRARDEITKLYANPPRADILAAKRAANRPLTDALVEMLADAGKTPKPHHFSNEARLCNWVVTGSFAAVDEKALSNADATLLEQVRDRDRAFLMAGLDYETRKTRLVAYATRARTKLLCS